MSLALREVTRFLRQRTRVIGAFGQPVIFWVLFGAGLGGSFRMPQAESARLSYQEYFLPGVAVMILLFTAIFATISIIEDRREGFLQGVLAAPIPRLSLVLGKLCGATFLAVGQALHFVLLAPILQFVNLAPPMPIGFGWTELPAIIGFLTLTAFALTALGYLIAWPMDSTQGFHAVMSIFLMPMWLLSGAFFPPPDSGWLKWVITLNPLTYGVAGLRRLMTNSQTGGLEKLPSLSLCLLVMLLFAGLCVSLDVWLTRRPRAD